MSPYVIYKCAVSADGCLDDASGERLALSHPLDRALLDTVRADCDAIMVGAETVRRDNPRLTIRSGALKAKRLARGLPAVPVKVTVTGSGNLPLGLNFFSVGEGERLVYCPDAQRERLQDHLGTAATVVAAGEASLDLTLILNDLYSRGVKRLLVEGGSSLGTRFLQLNLVDELQLSVAPFFVGEAAAPRFALPGSYPFSPRRRMELQAVQRVGDMALITWQLKKSAVGSPL